MKPSVGRIVHFVARGTPAEPMGNADEHRAAVVLSVFPCLMLKVMSVYGDYVTAADEDPTGLAGGTWHWPEREDPRPLVQT